MSFEFTGRGAAVVVFTVVVEVVAADPVGAVVVTVACVVVVCVLSEVKVVVSDELLCCSFETVAEIVVLLCEAAEAEVSAIVSDESVTVSETVEVCSDDAEVCDACALLELTLSFDESAQPESRNAAASEIISSFLFILKLTFFRFYFTL